MNETIETIRHSITVQLIEYKKSHPSSKNYVDGMITSIKRDCYRCHTDEEEVAVLKRWQANLIKWGYIK